MPATKPTAFVVFTSPRTGSSWLIDLLDSHPRIAAYAELFLPGDRSTPDYGSQDLPRFEAALTPRWRITRVPARLRYLRRVFAARDGVGAAGFKLMYGHPEVHPQPETYWGNVNPIGPRGVYDEAKRYAEALTMAYHRQQGVDTAVVRIFNTYGPRMRANDGRAIPTFLRQALEGKPVTVFGDGSQTRSFCYVDDLIRGIVLLGESHEHLPVNLGNPDEKTLVELAQTILRLTDSSSEIVYEALPVDDPQVRQPDITRATQILGWAPEIALEDGLRKTIASLGHEAAVGSA